MRHFCDKMEAYIRGVSTKNRIISLLISVTIDKLPSNMKRNLESIHKKTKTGSLTHSAAQLMTYLLEAGNTGHTAERECKSTVYFLQRQDQRRRRIQDTTKDYKRDTSL